MIELRAPTPGKRHLCRHGFRNNDRRLNKELNGITKITLNDPVTRQAKASANANISFTRTVGRKLGKQLN